jgi:NDP-sugar pyrophosphorylase family protein
VRSVYPDLITGDSRSVHAFVSNASFRDIGTPADCLLTSIELAASEGDRLISQTAEVDKTAVIQRSVLWDDVRVAAGARLTECVVGDGSVIPPDAVYEKCAIVPATGLSCASGERIEHSLLVRPF